MNRIVEIKLTEPGLFNAMYLRAGGKTNKVRVVNGHFSRHDEAI